MPSYGFSFRSSTRRDGGAGSIYLRLVHGGESRSVTTPYKVFPDEWDPGGRRLRIPYDHTERARQLKEYEAEMLNDLRRMERVVKKFEKQGAYTIDELMEYFRAVMTGNSLRVYVEKLSSELRLGGSYRTAQAYITAAKRLVAFNGGRDVKAEHFTSTLISDFQQALVAEGKSRNTIAFYLRNLRAIYNKAITEGLVSRHSENPFAGIHTGVAQTRKLALSQDDLARLSELNPAERGGWRDFGQARGPGRKSEPLRERVVLAPRLEQALAMFLFCYHARGMCFVDMAHLRKTDLKGDTIRYRRLKTGQMIEISVHPTLRKIIEWFAPMTAGSPYLFPVITDPKKNIRLQYESGLRLQNVRLKQVAKLTGIAKPISTHVARHSWATVAKVAGFPLAVISEALGHSNQKTTEIYLASLEKSVLDEASMVVSNAIRPGWRSSKRSRRHTGGGSGGIPLYMLGQGQRFAQHW